MTNESQKGFRCEKASCGCAKATTGRCVRGDGCDCRSTRLRLQLHEVDVCDGGFSGAAMNPRQSRAFEKEITSARALMRQNEHDQAFVHLERAHVLGQQHAAPHVLSHWLMLRVAVHRREPAAILGQAARIVLGAVGSVVGSVPTGNTGGTNISMFKRLPIEPELLKVMEDRDVRRS